MDEKFQDKSAKVIAVDASGSTRHLLTEYLKDLGFSNVQGLTTPKDVIEHLEVEPCDWIITPLAADQPENAFSILKLCTLHPNLKKVRVSLLLEESEKSCLPSAFELGLISWHKKPFTKETLVDDFGALLKLFEEHKFNSTLVSAEYLRRFFREKKEPKLWFEFERSLSDLYPGTPKLLLNLAEPQFLAGDKEGGKATLRQIMVLDPNMTDDVNKVKTVHLGADERLTSKEGSAINVLGIKNAVVVDPDDSIQRTLKGIFTELGIEQVQLFGDGESAAKWIKENPDPALVIQEWRIPKLTGPLFLQKIIADGAVSTPIVVLSSLVKPDDMPLVKEMGVANIFMKPFDKVDFLKSLVWTIQQERLPSESGSQERKIRNLIKAKKIKEAGELVTAFLANTAIPVPKRKLIEAEYAFVTNDMVKARTACIESIKLAGDSILSLNLLGKILMRLQDFNAALKCLEKAQSLSPLNVERLCSIAEAHSELGNEKEAEKALNDAKDIDPDSQKIKETEVGVAMASGDLNSAKQLMDQLESLDGIFAFMNNKAVALARSGKVDEGIEQYRKTIQALPDDDTEFKSRVYYNLALAYARQSELDEAIVQLDKSLKKPSKKIKLKAESLKKRIEQALKTGGDFHLDTAVPSATVAGTPVAAVKSESADATKNKEEKEAAPVEESLSENELLVRGLLATRGEMGCYLIFNNKIPQDELSKKLLATIPRYTPRNAIKRKETLGADRGLKSA